MVGQEYLHIKLNYIFDQKTAMGQFAFDECFTNMISSHPKKYVFLIDLRITVLGIILISWVVESISDENGMGFYINFFS